MTLERWIWVYICVGFSLFWFASIVQNKWSIKTALLQLLAVMLWPLTLTYGVVEQIWKELHNN